MLESVDEPFGSAFTTMKQWLVTNRTSNAVLLCHKSDMACFDPSATQEEDDVMSRVLIILVNDEIMKSRSFACELLRKVESSIKPCSLLIILPSFKQERDACKSYLLVLCLLISLCKETCSSLRIFIKAGLPIGHVMRYVSQLPY
jgi:hypothetical protein